MFLELAAKRYSCRAYESRAVEKEKIDRLCKAAQLAPTGCNKQAPRLFVIQSPEAQAKIRSCTPCHFNAPVMLLVCYDSGDLWHRSYDGWDTGYTDAASAVVHILLAAADEGLGTCWVGCFDPQKVKAQFNLPSNLVPAALIPVGYPAQGPSPMHGDRLPLTETVTYL